MFNAIRTTLLLAVMTGLFMAIGFIVAGTFGMFFALAFALVTNFIAYWNSDKVVLRMQRAKEIGWHESPDIFELVERLAAQAEIPMPKIYVMENKQPNAFATGRNPENAAIALSTGLLELLDYDEVGAVIAHEMAHIRSRDTLTMTVTATFAGAISMLAQFGLFFGVRNTSSPLGPVASIVMIIVAPMAALLVQMAVSRTREYEADMDGAQICGDPLALARALDKISKRAKNFENPFARRSPGMAHLFIINPLAGRGTDNLFSTHPNVENRIAALLELSKQMQVEEPQQGYLDRARPNANANNAGWRTPNSHVSDKNQPKGPWG